MKTIGAIGLAMTLAFGLVASAMAADPVTVTGKVMCAKCTLQ
jgi:hypothetical protein